MTDLTEKSMTDIRDMKPGTSGQYGAITVQRFADPADQAPQFNYDHDGFWRFSITTGAGEVWIRLHANAIGIYEGDQAILDTVGAELLQMALATDADAVLADSRGLAGLKPEDLYA